LALTIKPDKALQLTVIPMRLIYGKDNITKSRNLFVQTPWDSRCSCWWNRRRSFFRRWVKDTLMSEGLAFVIQVITSGVAFGLAHASWTLLARRDLKFSLPAVISTSILGVFLAIIYLVGGRNLGPCIFAHVMINVVLEPWLMLSAVSGKWRIKQAVADSGGK
jgi:hypothetical protein